MRVRSHDDHGFLLVEVIISIALTSMVILALAVGLLTALRSSDAANHQQTLDSALSSASESIRSMPYPTSTSTCPTAQDYQDSYEAYVSSGLGWSDPDTVVTVDSIEHWDPDTGGFGACPATDSLAHRLVLEVDVGLETARGQVVVGMP